MRSSHLAISQGYKSRRGQVPKVSTDGDCGCGGRFVAFAIVSMMSAVCGCSPRSFESRIGDTIERLKEQIRSEDTPTLQTIDSYLLERLERVPAGAASFTSFGAIVLIRENDECGFVLRWCGSVPDGSEVLIAGGPDSDRVKIDIGDAYVRENANEAVRYVLYQAVLPSSECEHADFFNSLQPDSCSASIVHEGREVCSDVRVVFYPSKVDSAGSSDESKGRSAGGAPRAEDGGERQRRRPIRKKSSAQ